MTYRFIAAAALVIGLCSFARSGEQDILITEFMARNSSSDILDGDGDSSDFIEFFNAGAAAVDTGGYSITDDPFDFRKWNFPAGVVMQPGAFLLVWASGKNRRDPCCELHANFELSGMGEFLGMVDPAGDLIQDFTPFPLRILNYIFLAGLEPDAGDRCRRVEGCPNACLF